MPPDDFEDYLKFLAAVLRVRQSRQKEIFSELRDHFAERVEELQSQGTDRERAAALAQQEFGDAAALAAQFMQVIRQRRRRIVMRSTIGVISAVLVGIVTTLAFWPGVGPVASSLVAEEKPSSKQTPAALLASAERDAATREKLAQPAEAEFVEMPLQEVFNYLAACTKVQFYVKKRAVNELAISLETPVTISLRNVPASMILHLILEEQGLDSTIQEGVVIISSPQDLENPEQLIVKVYDLQKWLGISPSPKEAERLIEVITAAVYPQSWCDVGGAGSIESLMSPKSRGLRKSSGGSYSATAPRDGKNTRLPEGAVFAHRPLSQEFPEADLPATAGNFQGMIVVCHTARVHERICNLLEQLRVALKQKGLE